MLSRWQLNLRAITADAKARVLAAVRLDEFASGRLRNLMLGELNEIGSEDEATKWAHRRLSEKNKLNATDAKHIEEAFRAKLFILLEPPLARDVFVQT